jgi:hypothetical protein
MMCKKGKYDRTLLVMPKMKVCLALVLLLRYLEKMILCHQKTEMIMRGFQHSPCVVKGLRQNGEV